MRRSRRDFVKLTAYGLGFSAVATGLPACVTTNTSKLGRVVIVGGGYAGNTAAKYLRMWSMGAIEVVVVEKNSQFVSCPLSNLVLGGSKTIDDL
ncbi:MAG TPA: FAD/NAD(P)-binding oxidoreductase, partial [Methylotenera sp.]|nr:FAD/NAD(P)-binding oxidoreductase [Methylotenera sp.]